MSRTGDADDDLHPLGDSVEAVARSLRGSSARAALTVFQVWPEVAGPALAGHAQPVSLDDGRLVVVVDQPGWATQLRYLEADLLQGLDAALGAGVVQALVVRVGRP